MTEITVTEAAAKYGIPEATLRVFAERGCSPAQRLMDPITGYRDGVLYVQDDQFLERLVVKIRAGRKVEA